MQSLSVEDLEVQRRSWQSQVPTAFELSVLALMKLLTNKFVLNLLPNLVMAVRWCVQNGRTLIAKIACLHVSARQRQL